MKNFKLTLLIFVLVACGQHPSDLLRVGQSVRYDFPLYVSSGDASGTIWKLNENGTKEVFVTGLNDPRGLAVDKYQNLYVVEFGAQQVKKINLNTKAASVIASGLMTPSVVAVNSFGEVYVNQESANNIIRVRDRKIIQTYTSRPTAIAFGINDIMLVGLFDQSKVLWGSSLTSPSDTVQEPVVITTDINGRTYVAEGTETNAKVYRYHQTDPGGKVTVADGLSGASGIAVDTVGNIYIAEPGASRISLVTFKNQFFFWTNIPSPQYMAFTQY